jgi:AcrR family transcriptional regulator
MATRTRPQMTLETRATLIALAREAFGARGYAATSLDELTAAAGLTRGALYHHFDSKRGLFEAVVAQIEDELDEQVESATDAAGGGWTGFRAGARAYLEAMQSAETRRIVLQDAPAVIAKFAQRTRMQLCTASMVETLRALMRDGNIRRTDPDALANVIAGAVNNAAAWAATRPDPMAALVAAQETVDGLLDSLRLAEPAQQVKATS